MLTFTNQFLKNLLFLVFALSVTSGCRNERSQVAEKRPTAGATPSLAPTPSTGLLDSINSQLNSASEYVSSVSPQAKELQNATVEEMDKLFQVEYKVSEISASSTAPQLEKLLADLGKEGWECFSILPENAGLRVVCKRRPRSVLRYLKAVPLF